MSEERRRRLSIRLCVWAEHRGWRWLTFAIKQGWWPVWRAWNLHVWPRLEWWWVRVSRPSCKIHRRSPLMDGVCLLCMFEQQRKIRDLKP